MISSTPTPAPPAAVPEQLPLSLRHIAQALERQRDLKPAQMRKLVLEANVTIEDLLPWADFNHPVEDSYGRKLVYQGENFEIMVMSWEPGDFSTIHDHGHTQWGAVQVFGPAEHATFRMDNDKISTLARWQMKPGEAIGVHHSLLHQMGNPTEERFLTLHVYGELENIDNVTGDARVMDLEHENIQRVDGGVFFALPPEGVKRTEAGPRPDFPTRLRHMVELIRRLRKMEAANRNNSGKDIQAITDEFMSDSQQAVLLKCLTANTDENDHQSNSVYWRILNQELKEAAQLQNELFEEEQQEDKFHKYAELYDALIGQPCLDSFMAAYLTFFTEKFQINLQEQTILSIGCGTGLTERYIIDELGANEETLLGIDISGAMVQEASRRIRAEEGDVLELGAGQGQWDIAYSGLNVFHYLPFEELEHAIQRTASIIKPGGYFLGDFITPDHIRWYPNVMYSADKNIISLRTPRLVEKDGRMFQESEITNISFEEGKMRITYAGKHLRFLPPMHRIRLYFERYFEGGVQLFDAKSLNEIPEWADSCTSTRYVVVARR